MQVRYTIQCENPSHVTLLVCKDNQNHIYKQFFTQRRASTSSTRGILRQYLLAPSKGFGAVARSLERLVASLGRATLAVYASIIVGAHRKRVVVCTRTTIGSGGKQLFVSYANNYWFVHGTNSGLMANDYCFRPCIPIASQILSTPQVPF